VSSWPFDHPAARRLTAARQAFLRRLLAQLPDRPLRTALDAGCGVGYFSGFLRELGLEVVAFDGRPDTVAEAQRRFPEINFRVADVESPGIRDFGRFDLVLCMGLLYHTENPFLVVRNMHALARSLLVIETMCIPGRAPVLLLRDEVTSVDQGLRRVALYPTEAVVVAMLYRAGFPHVYRSADPPEHPDFRPGLFRRRKRTIVVASQAPLSAASLRRAPDLLWSVDTWLTFNQRLRLAAGQAAQGVRRLRRIPARRAEG